jgi:hypothetical protein
LFEAADGSLVGIARWPSVELRTELFGEGLEREASAVMRDCIEQMLPPLELRELTNLWAPDASAKGAVA